MTIFVDYAAISSTQSALKTGHAEIEATLARLKGLVGNLVETGFRTEKASGAFFQSFDAWNAGAIQAINGLEGMQQALQAVIQGHQDLDAGLAGGAQN